MRANNWSLRSIRAGAPNCVHAVPRLGKPLPYTAKRRWAVGEKTPASLLRCPQGIVLCDNSSHATVGAGVASNQPPQSKLTASLGPTPCCIARRIAERSLQCCWRPSLWRRRGFHSSRPTRQKGFLGGFLASRAPAAAIRPKAAGRTVAATHSKSDWLGQQKRTSGPLKVCCSSRHDEGTMCRVGVDGLRSGSQASPARRQQRERQPVAAAIRSGVRTRTQANVRIGINPTSRRGAPWFAKGRSSFGCRYPCLPCRTRTTIRKNYRLKLRDEICRSLFPRWLWFPPRLRPNGPLSSPYSVRTLSISPKE